MQPIYPMKVLLSILSLIVTQGNMVFVWPMTALPLRYSGLGKTTRTAKSSENQRLEKDEDHRGRDINDIRTIKENCPGKSKPKRIN